jgi:hypothetical protein
MGGADGQPNRKVIAAQVMELLKFMPVGDPAARAAKRVA